jgi:hypothetical protein
VATATAARFLAALCYNNTWSSPYYALALAFGGAQPTPYGGANTVAGRYTPGDTAAAIHGRHYYAMTYDAASGEACMYVDGILAASVATSAANALAYGATVGRLRLGASFAPDGYQAGRYEDFQLCDVARSASWIADAYVAGK